MTEGIQLLPETHKRIQVIRPEERRLFFLSFLIPVLVIAFYLVLSFYLSKKESHLDSIISQIVALEKLRDKNAETELTRVSKQLAVSGSLISNHALWSIGLSKLERLTKPKIQLQTLTLDLNSQSIEFVAQGDGYITVARQVATILAEDSITNLDLNQIKSLANGRVEFGLKLIFDPVKFFKAQE